MAWLFTTLAGVMARVLLALTGVAARLFLALTGVAARLFLALAGLETWLFLALTMAEQTSLNRWNFMITTRGKTIFVVNKVTLADSKL